MAESDSDPNASPPDRPFQFSLRSLLMAVAVVALALGVWKSFDKRFLEPVRHSNEILRMIDSLAMKRPSGLTRGQWGVAVGWTHNLHCNSLLAYQADLPEIRSFQRRLEERIGAGVDMATIDWIWDQYAELTETGNEYQWYREHMMLPQMQTVGPNGDPMVLNVP